MSRGPTARELMRRHLVAVGPEESLGAAGAVLRLARLRGVPVLEEGRLVGEFSTRELTDVLRESLRGGRTEGTHAGAGPEVGVAAISVRRVMAPARPGVGLETLIDEIGRRLASEGRGYLSVLDPDDVLVGIVTESDLLRAALRAAPRPAEGAATPPAQP